MGVHNTFFCMLFLKFQKHTGESCVREQKNGRGCFWNISVSRLISAFTKGNPTRIPLRNFPAHISDGCFRIVPTLYTCVNVSMSVKCSTEAEWKNFIPKFDVCHSKSRLASVMAFAVPPEWQHIKIHQKMRLRRRFIRFGPNAGVFCFLFGKKNQMSSFGMKPFEFSWRVGYWTRKLAGALLNDGVNIHLWDVKGQRIMASQLAIKLSLRCNHDASKKKKIQNKVFYFDEHDLDFYKLLQCWNEWVQIVFFELIPSPRVFVYLSGFDKALVSPFARGDLDYQLTNGRSQ